MMSRHDFSRLTAAEAAERGKRRRKEIEDVGVLEEETLLVLSRISRIASAALNMPIAHVSILDGDRQWVRAAVGIEQSDLPIREGFCIHAIEAGEMLVVEDTKSDHRFADSKFVTGDPHIRFYAGVPLVTQNDIAIGTLCAVDRTPRVFRPEERAILNDLAELTMHQLELGRAAFVDGLTGSWNRRMMGRVATAELRRSSRTGRTFSVAMLDLDKFKQLNDTFGHGAGDDVLIRFTELIRERLRPEDWLFRLGGEEFGILIVHAGVEEANSVIERIRLAVALEGPLAKTRPVTFSAGVTEHRPGTMAGTDTLKSMLERADRALYKAKREGRDRTVCEPGSPQH